MRTDDPLGLAPYYEQRGRLLIALGDLRDLAQLRNRREDQWRRIQSWEHAWLHRRWLHKRVRSELRRRGIERNLTRAWFERIWRDYRGTPVTEGF